MNRRKWGLRRRPAARPREPTWTELVEGKLRRLPSLEPSATPSTVRKKSLDEAAWKERCNNYSKKCRAKRSEDKKNELKKKNCEQKAMHCATI